MHKVAEPTVGKTSFEGYYREHLSEVYRFTLSRLRNHEDAEDATQSTFLKALQSLSAGHVPTNASAWLIAIARNVCHDDGRRALRRPEQVALHSSTGLAVEETSEDFSVIIAGLYGLPKRERSVIVWRELEGRSRLEIASKLGISEKQVTKLLGRARDDLREQIVAGVTCAAVQESERRGKAETTTRVRRAFEAHRRWCPRCSAAGLRPRSKLGLLQPLWLALGSLHLLGRTRHAANMAQPAATVGSGGAVGALAGKAALLVAVGAVSGGIAWHHEAGRAQHTRNTTPAASAATRRSTPVVSYGPDHHLPAVGGGSIGGDRAGVRAVALRSARAGRTHGSTAGSGTPALSSPAVGPAAVVGHAARAQGAPALPPVAAGGTGVQRAAAPSSDPPPSAGSASDSDTVAPTSPTEHAPVHAPAGQGGEATSDAATPSGGQAAKGVGR